MKKIVLLLFVIIAANSVFSQTQTKAWNELSFMRDSISNSNKSGKVLVTCDSRLETTIYNFSSAFRRKAQKVWRVQIYFGEGRQGKFQAQSVKSQFEQDHPGISTYLIFEEPYFKVRVGDFESKLEAESLRMLLIEEYDKLFTIEDSRK